MADPVATAPSISSPVHAAAPRRGPSISVKMILTTTAMIILIVVGFGALNIWNIGQLIDSTVKEKEGLIRDNVGRVGVATVQTAASSMTSWLDGNDNASLREYVADLVQHDATIRSVYVLSSKEGLWAHSDESRNPPPGPLPPITGTDLEASWSHIKGMWEQRAAKDPGSSPLIASEELGGTSLFAMPVLKNVSKPTVHSLKDPGPLGYVVIGYKLDALDEAINAARLKKKEAYKDIGYKTVGVGMIFMLFGTLLAILQGLRISKPIKMLAWRADQIARGDLATRVDVSSSDEIGLLGSNFNFMADQLVILLQETAAKATLEKELEVAKTIQDTLVPGPEPIDRQYVKLAGYFQPASQCGGDWWTYHDLQNGKVLIVIGDVTGHGVPSAMITAAAKAACDVARSVHGDDVTCEQLLEIMNKAIFESAKRKFVMTCFASIIDPKAGTISYANAGHNFPYLYRENNGQGEFGSLMTRGNRLGDIQDSKYVSKTQELKPGDVLIWYTDGIVECENGTGEEYGEKRFRSSIRRAAAMEPGEMRDSVVSASHQFFGDRPRKDDITMVFARVYG
jgi:serine phosphatase RsbU (regulator of sigma subunit)/HAMP domain-containing protein